MKERVCYLEPDELPLKHNQTPICYFCEKEVTADDYCYGCKHFVCEECNSFSPFGGHFVEEHQEEEQEEDENEELDPATEMKKFNEL